MHWRTSARLAIVAVLGVIVVGVGGAGTACHQDRSRGLARVRHSGVLRWGGDLAGGEPYVSEDPAHRGRYVGFEVDLAAALARELGVRQEFVQNDWDNLVPSLERGSFDIIMNGLEVTPARANQILYTRPYYVFAERLVARHDDASITNLASLRGRRVGTLTNSLAWTILNRVGADVVATNGTSEHYDNLENRRVDAVLLDDIIAQRYGLNRPSLRFVADVAENYYAIGVRRGENDLRDALNAALDRIAASGELRRILDRHNLDGPRQDRLVHWTEAQTRQLLAETQRTRFGWSHFALFLKGALVTLLVSVGAMILAIPFGMSLAIARLYAPRWLAGVATAYVELFRGTPVLLQLYVIYYALAPVIAMDAFTAAILGLGLNYAAYEAEVYRAGIQAVPRGQTEAALSLGMSTPLALRRVIMPQAFRLALPSVTNDFIALLKDSSLVSVITVIELTKRFNIVAVEVGNWLLPGLLCAGLYFVMSYPLSIVARRLEARLARG
jgi:polar amino acid transport system substrate-binding protein